MRAAVLAYVEDSAKPRVPATPRLLEEARLAELATAFSRGLPLAGSVEPHLRAMLEDVLHGPGGLVRGQLALAMGERSGLPWSVARALAVAVEYFHTASLLFDDLPSMDDATTRRGRACAHLTHGEGVATLGALALVTRGYALLWEAFEGLEPAARARVGGFVSECLGVAGILTGQAADLRFGAGEGDLEAAASGKTVPLLRLALVLPAIVGGGCADRIANLEQLASVWGLAYQVVDDLKDVHGNERDTGKSVRRDAALGRPSLVVVSGRRRALARLRTLLEQSRSLLEELAATTSDDPLQRLQRALESSATAPA